jgi:hypothetical protein
MQRISMPILFVAAITSVFMACKKEPLSQASPDRGIAKGGEVREGRECAELVRLQCGMLSFNDQAHFQEVYDCLEAAYEAHLDAFEAQYGYLSEDDYNDTADQLGFVDEQPLIDFEVVLGFQSYRKVFDNLESQWLGSGMDLGNDPDDSRCVDDPIHGALLNSSGALMVGNVIYFLNDDCEWLYIQDGDCSDYNICIIDPPSCSGVKAWFAIEVGDKCYYNEESVAWDQSSNKRYKQRFRHELTVFPYTSPTGALVSVQKCYRKRLGVWVRHRAQQSMTTNGTVFRSDFVRNISVAGYASDRRWRRVLRVEMSGPYQGLVDRFPYFQECGVQCSFTNPIGSRTIKLPPSCN